MRFDLFTLFPPCLEAFFGSSILQRAQAAGQLDLGVHDIRQWATDRHHTCDDYPFGGGPGMVLLAEPVVAALENVLNFKAGVTEPPCPVILMSPQGRTLTQDVARELAGYRRVALVCAHYEGLDERAIQCAITDQISIGDYVLTGGELAAAVVVDATARMVPQVLGNPSSAGGDTHSCGLLEGPQYTRPAQWRGNGVPEVLLSGNHAAIAAWRLREAARRTRRLRPDLWQRIWRWPGWKTSERAILDEVARSGWGGRKENEDGS